MAIGKETSLGAEFARAFCAKDAARLRELLHPEISFRALTPNASWEADDPEAVITILFGSWLEASDVVDSLDHVETSAVADRDRVGYRFTVSNPDGTHVVEQQAYLGERDDRIDWMRVVCSGFRPA